MSNNSSVTNIRAIATEIRLVSIAGFWLQLLLGSVPIAWLLISSINRKFTPQQARLTSTGSSWFIGFLALVALVSSVIWWYRQLRLARRIPDRDERPSRASMIKSLQTGFILNLISMALLVLAALGYGWLLFFRVISNPQGVVFMQPGALVPQPVFTQLDALAILAIIHTVAAGLIGMIGYLWLLKRVTEYRISKKL
jgi:hypothetical protein